MAAKRIISARLAMSNNNENRIVNNMINSSIIKPSVKHTRHSVLYRNSSLSKTSNFFKMPDTYDSDYIENKNSVRSNKVGPTIEPCECLIVVVFHFKKGSHAQRQNHRCTSSQGSHRFSFL